LELLALPNLKVDADMKTDIVSYLSQCHNGEEGGFRGAPYIKSHVASTYAAVMTLVNIASEEGYKMVDLPGMKKYLTSVKNNYQYCQGASNIFGFLKDEDMAKMD
jgi:prenyltransferase beta subunit